MRKLLLFSVMIVLIFACGSGSKKSFEKAREYESSGLYVDAAEADLKALRQDPHFTEALVHLKEIAPKAYDELMNRARHLEQANNWDQVVSEYRHLDRLISEFHRFGVVFATDDIKARLGNARNKAAAFHFKNAESLAGNGKWQEAAFAYLKASDYIENYNGSLEKGMQAFVEAGDAAMADGDYESAIIAYERVLEIRPRHSAALERLASAHYIIGRQRYDNQDYRGALVAFETVLDVQPGYKDTESWRKKAHDAAVQHVAVFPFLNESRHTVDGYFIATEIYSRLMTRKMDFVEFLPNAESISLIRQASGGPTGRVSESQLTNVARKNQLNSVVWGKVKEVMIREKPEEVVEYEHVNVHTTKDESGNDVETEETIYFREHKVGRYLRVRIEYFIIDTETGKYLDNQRFTQDVDDEAIWIGYQGSVYDLPEDKRQYLDAPRQPPPVQVTMDKVLVAIADQITRHVERYYE